MLNVGCLMCLAFVVVTLPCFFYVCVYFNWTSGDDDEYLGAQTSEQPYLLYLSTLHPSFHSLFSLSNSFSLTFSRRLLHAVASKSRGESENALREGKRPTCFSRAKHCSKSSPAHIYRYLRVRCEEEATIVLK
ncbi:hypothetical protein EX30DRAFT_259247 [Ascodesmis nigricans]|uniref:Uncharacterized protein n=1 Tax=Ascodesmis nigricans TaxID=341454 RepID=A0A4S2MXN5_9PEZI|nr:hypothetical protein EX30DRAFT_259247 [Ascodesmis nigricans]